MTTLVDVRLAAARRTPPVAQLQCRRRPGWRRPQRYRAPIIWRALPQQPADQLDRGAVVTSADGRENHLRDFNLVRFAEEGQLGQRQRLVTDLFERYPPDPVFFLVVLRMAIRPCVDAHLSPSRLFGFGNSNQEADGDREQLVPELQAESLCGPALGKGSSDHGRVPAALRRLAWISAPRFHEMR
jgi:hypothetical protein